MRVINSMLHVFYYFVRGKNSNNIELLFFIIIFSCHRLRMESNELKCKQIYLTNLWLSWNVQSDSQLSIIDVNIETHVISCVFFVMVFLLHYILKILVKWGPVCHSWALLKNNSSRGGLTIVKVKNLLYFSDLKRVLETIGGE